MLEAHRSLFNDEARQAYEPLWAASRQRSVFSHPDALQAISSAFGLRLSLAYVRDTNGLAAALPVFEKARGPFRAVALPALIPVVSPLLASPLAEHEVHARHSPLDRLLTLTASHYSQASLLLHPSLEDTRSFLWSGWNVQPRYTYEIALANDDLLASWSRGSRRTARQAAAQYRIEEGAHHIASAVDLMLEAYAERAVHLGVTAEGVVRLAHQFAKRGLARVFAALPDDAPTAPPEAAVVIAHDNRTAYYWLAGSRPGAAMTVLLAHVLTTLRDDGVELFDFAGANTPSIAEFKRRFGPRLCLYHSARIVPSRTLRLLQQLPPSR